MALKSTTIQAYDWDAVISAFAKLTGMSFGTQGAWNLNLSKLAGHPDFSGHRILQHEQDYAYIEGGRLKEYCVKTLDEVLAKSDKGDYKGKVIYGVPYFLVIEYLIANDVLPENETFLITNVNV